MSRDQIHYHWADINQNYKLSVYEVVQAAAQMGATNLEQFECHLRLHNQGIGGYAFDATWFGDSPCDKAGYRWTQTPQPTFVNTVEGEADVVLDRVFPLPVDQVIDPQNCAGSPGAGTCLTDWKIDKNELLMLINIENYHTDALGVDGFGVGGSVCNGMRFLQPVVDQTIKMGTGIAFAENFIWDEAASNSGALFDPYCRNEEKCATALRDFSMVSGGRVMSWAKMQPTLDKAINFARADAVIEFAREHGVEVVGSFLVDFHRKLQPYETSAVDSNTGALIDYATAGDLRLYFPDFVFSLTDHQAQHWSGVLTRWNAVNEISDQRTTENSTWGFVPVEPAQVLNLEGEATVQEMSESLLREPINPSNNVDPESGEGRRSPYDLDSIVAALTIARNNDPDVKLYYNDTSNYTNVLPPYFLDSAATATHNQVAYRCYRIARYLQEQEVTVNGTVYPLLDGVGFQSHLSAFLFLPKDAACAEVDATNMEQMLTGLPDVLDGVTEVLGWYRAAGFKFAITELDVLNSHPRSRHWLNGSDHFGTKPPPWWKCADMPLEIRRKVTGKVYEAYINAAQSVYFDELEVTLIDVADRSTWLRGGGGGGVTYDVRGNPSAVIDATPFDYYFQRKQDTIYSSVVNALVD